MSRPMRLLAMVHPTRALPTTHGRRRPPSQARSGLPVLLGATRADAPRAERTDLAATHGRVSRKRSSQWEGSGEVGEPEGDLALGGLCGVGGVDEVLAGGQGQITPTRPASGLPPVGGAVERAYERE